MGLQLWRKWRALKFATVSSSTKPKFCAVGACPRVGSVRNASETVDTRARAWSVGTELNAVLSALLSLEAWNTGRDNVFIISEAAAALAASSSSSRSAVPVAMHAGPQLPPPSRRTYRGAKRSFFIQLMEAAVPTVPAVPSFS